MSEPALPTLMVRSSEALARYRLSAEKETSETPCVWPRSVCAHFHSLPTPSVFHSRIVMSAELLASHWPSGENLMQETARRWPVSVLVHTYRDGAACVLGVASVATTGLCGSAIASPAGFAAPARVAADGGSRGRHSSGRPPKVRLLLRYGCEARTLGTCRPLDGPCRTLGDAARSMLRALSAVPRGARLAAVWRGSRRRRALSSNAGELRCWQLGTLSLEVACTPCVVTAPWGSARKGAAFAPPRPAADSAFAEACRALLNPANPSLAGTARPYFPRGGPLPPPPTAGLLRVRVRVSLG